MLFTLKLSFDIVLQLTHISDSRKTNVGITELVNESKQTQDILRTAIGRNFKDLPELIEAYDEAVRKLEGHLAKYLHNPDKLPEKTPMCKVKKEDQSKCGE